MTATDDMNKLESGNFVEGLGEFKLDITPVEAMKMAQEAVVADVADYFANAKVAIGITPEGAVLFEGIVDTARSKLWDAEDQLKGLGHALSTPQGRAALAISVIVMVGCGGGFAGAQKDSPTPEGGSAPTIEPAVSAEPTALGPELTEAPTVEVTPTEAGIDKLLAKYEGVPRAEIKVLGDPHLENATFLSEFDVNEEDGKVVAKVPPEVIATELDYIKAHEEELRAELKPTVIKGKAFPGGLVVNFRPDQVRIVSRFRINVNGTDEVTMEQGGMVYMDVDGNLNLVHVAVFNARTAAGSDRYTTVNESLNREQVFQHTFEGLGLYAYYDGSNEMLNDRFKFVANAFAEASPEMKASLKKFSETGEVDENVLSFIFGLQL